MSNNNQIPWKIIIPAIVVILAAIIGATWTTWLNPPPSDFGISVNPMKGEVHKGGVITTAITIKGIQGYEHPVSLSASGYPSDIVVTFILPIVGSIPSYTSTVMIKVNPSVPAGSYKIIMKGTGADRKEHSCSYTLTVKSPIKPTPSPIITPTLTPTPTSMPMQMPTHPTSLKIQISQCQWPEKVSKGKEVNFSWEIILHSELLPAYKEYCFEIVDSKGRIIEEYPKRFHIESEEISGNESWKVPLERVKTPTGLYRSTITFPCDDPLVLSTTYFEVVEILLVIQKFNDTNLNGKIDDADERLAGWEFKVTDPFRETSTHFTDVNGEIRIEIMEGKEGKYTIEEIVKTSWRSVPPIKQTVIVPKGKTTTVKFLNTILSTAGLIIQKFNDTNLNGKIDDADERLAGWEFKVTDPSRETSTHFTDVNGEIRIEIPKEYKGKDYIIEETLLPGWKPVLPIKQKVNALKDEGIIVKFLNKKPIPIILTYYDFELDDVCTYEDNYCGWANASGKAVIYGSMTKSNITVPEGASELEVTISICCNAWTEGLSGPEGSTANIRVDDIVKKESIDSSMSYHHGNYYKYEYCNTFSNTFNCSGKEEITLKIEMSGGARLDFEQAKLLFS